MTAKQKQCLLCFLGYYSGDIDGKWGKLSVEATERFQKAHGLTPDGIFGPATEAAIRTVIFTGEAPTPQPERDGWEGIRYFKREEFGCKCGKYCDGYPVEPDWDLVHLLESIRAHFGKPLHINSGIRCQTHNRNEGGVSGSQHLRGTAADIYVEGVSPEEVADYAETLLPDTGGIGRYASFTHVDVRSTKSRWKG